MTENDYQLAWSLYAIAALGCLLVWFRMTGWMWRWLRESLRLLVAVLLLTPSVVDPGRELFAPAIAMTALDLLFKVGNPWQAVADLATYGMIAFALYVAFALLRWPLERLLKRPQPTQRRAPQQAPEPEPTLRQLMERDAPEVATRIDRHGERRLRIEPRI